VGVRLATSGAVLFAALYPLLGLGALVSDPGTPAVVLVCAVALVAPILGLHVRAVWVVAHGRDPAAPAVTVGALALLVAAGLPLTGWSPHWWEQSHVVLATAVLLLRGRWRVAVVAGCLVVLACLVGAGLVASLNGAWLVLWRAGETLAFTWFAAVLRRLVAAREALAAEVLLAERRRIDEHLERTLGDAIAAVAVGAGELAGRTAAGAWVSAEDVDAVVVRAQSAMAEVRRVARSYRQASLSGELATTAQLLADAGIAFRVDAPDGPLEGEAVAVVRRELPGVLADVLADQRVRACELVLVPDGAAGVRLTVHVERDEP
jgi:signal transduction histidine kinase